MEDKEIKISKHEIHRIKEWVPLVDQKLFKQEEADSRIKGKSSETMEARGRVLQGSI